MKIAAFFSAVFSVCILMTNCGNPSKDGSNTSTGPSIQQLVNDTTSAKHTFFLRFMDQQETDTSIIYTAKSLYHKDTVGLNVEVMKNIAAGIDANGQPDENLGFQTGSIRLSSIGNQSDALVTSMASLFNIEPRTRKMTTSTITPLVFSSNKHTVDLTSKSTYSFKLFIPNTVGEAAEVFAVVDLYKQSFELTEKDSTYRNQIIAAFEGQ